MTRTRGESSGSGGWWSSACTAMALHDLKFLVRERLSWRWKASGSKLGRLWRHWREMARVGRILVTGGGFCLSCVKIKRMGARKRPFASPAAAAVSFPRSTSLPRFSAMSSRRRAPRRLASAPRRRLPRQRLGGVGATGARCGRRRRGKRPPAPVPGLLCGLRLCGRALDHAPAGISAQVRRE